MKKLRVLHALEFYHPIEGGSQEVVKRLSEGLVKKGHDVTVVTSFSPLRRGVSEINGVKIKEFDITGKLAYGMKGQVEQYRQWILSEKFDLILNYAAQVWPFDALFPILGQIQGKKVLVPVGFSGLYLEDFKEYFKVLPEYIRQYDHIVCLSRDYRDIQYCKDQGLENYSIIPNGCSYEEFYEELQQEEGEVLRDRLGIPRSDFLVLHVGSHTGVKGHKEAIKIFDQAKIPNSTFVIVGNVFNKSCNRRCATSSSWSLIKRKLGFQNRQIVSIQLNREDTVRLYKMADLFLFPSNVECSPIVLVEAMASRTPFLTTAAGNSAEIAHDNRAGEVIKTRHIQSPVLYENAFADISDGAQKLRRLYFDPELRHAYGKNGREAWLKNYTWEKIIDQYEALYLSLFVGKQGKS